MRKLKLTLTLTLTQTDTGGAVLTLMLGYRSLYITWPFAITDYTYDIKYHYTAV